jgi:hypothetical protein
MWPIRTEFGRRSHHWSHHEFSALFSRGAPTAHRVIHSLPFPHSPKARSRRAPVAKPQRERAPYALRIRFAPVGAYMHCLVVLARCVVSPITSEAPCS